MIKAQLSDISYIKIDTWVFFPLFQIEMDFDVLFKDVKDNLFLKWTPSFSERVIEYANGQGNWKEYLHIDHDMKIDSGVFKFRLFYNNLIYVLEVCKSDPNPIHSNRLLVLQYFV